MNKAEKAQADGIVVVFSPESCVQCTATYRALDEASAVAFLATPEGDIRP